VCSARALSFQRLHDDTRWPTSRDTAGTTLNKIKRNEEEKQFLLENALPSSCDLSPEKNEEYLNLREQEAIRFNEEASHRLELLLASKGEV
jgi:hypothetical protein